MKRFATAVLSAFVIAAMCCPPVARADDKDSKIVITVRVPDDQKEHHSRSHPAPAPTLPAQ